MGLFYPDNPKRTVRVHQLVDDLTDLQAAVKDIGTQMDAANARYRPAIDALLRAHGMPGADDVINDAAAKMTPDERKVFEALIKTVRNTKTGLDTTQFVAGLLLAPEGFALTGKVAISIARWASRMVSVKGLANFFTAAEGGEPAAAAAASEIAGEAAESAEALEGVGEAAEAAGVAAEVGEAASIVASVSVFLDVLAGIGLVVGLVAGLVEVFTGAEQKRKLIDAIHRLQPARLTTAVFKREGTNILDQLTTLGLYLEASSGGADADPRIAAKASASTSACVELAKKMVSAIGLADSKIDAGALEDELEAQDRQARDFYGGADLSRDAVVAATSNR